MAGDSPAEGYAEQIEAMVDELARIVAAAPAERWTSRATDEDWSAAEICGHLVEMLPYWSAVAQEVAASPGMTFGRDEQDPRRIGGVAAGTEMDRHQALEQVRTAADFACRRIRALPHDGWQAEGISVTRGPMTVDAIIATLLVHHLEGHVAQVREAVGKG